MENWRRFKSIEELEASPESDQIQYWKTAYEIAHQMFVDCAENTMEQVDFYRNTIRNLRRQLQEAKANGNNQ